MTQPLLVRGRGGPQVWTRRQRAWTPDAIGGLVARLLASDVAQADNTAVSSWTGRVSAFAFTQATGSKQPTYYSSTSAHLINGQPTVYFDGTDDLLRYNGLVTSASSGHLIAVVRMVALTVGTTGTVACTADEASTARYLYWGVDRPVSDGRVNLSQRNNDTAENLSSTTTAVPIAAGAVALEWASDSSAYSFRVNGTTQSKTVTAGADNGDWAGDTSARDNTVVGCLKRTAEINFGNFDAAELLWVDGALSAGDRTELNSYINTQYGITMA